MDSLHYLLMKSHTMLSRKISTEAQKIGLTPGQPKVLDHLWAKQGDDQKTIAACCEIEAATLGSILLRMEQKDLIERRKENGNRRSLHVYLTANGEKVASQMQDIFVEADKNASSQMTEKELELLKHLLGKLCSNLEGNKE